MWQRPGGERRWRSSVLCGRDREERGGGGVACCVAETVVYDRLHDIEDDEHEVLWIRLKPKKILV